MQAKNSGNLVRAFVCAIHEHPNYINKLVYCCNSQSTEHSRGIKTSKVFRSSWKLVFSFRQLAARLLLVVSAIGWDNH